MDNFIDTHKDLTFPSGLRKLWGGQRHNTDRGRFTTALCQDNIGGCYLHIDAQPTLNHSFVTASGGTENAANRVKTALGERLTHLAGEMDGVLHHVDVDKGQFTYKLKGFDTNTLGRIMNDTPMAQQVRNIYDKFAGGSQDYGVVYQGELAFHDAIKQLPPADLKTTIIRATNALNVGDNLVETTQMAHLDQIEKQLAEKGLFNFRYVSFGKTGSCLEAETRAGSKVAVMLRKGGVERHALPQHLQPLYSFSTNTHHVEVTPMLNNTIVTEAHLNGLRDAVSRHIGPSGERFEVTDRVMRNLGLSHNGNAFYLDGDGIERVAARRSHAVPTPHDPRWVEADGTWKQYRDFRADHEAFNSPLHRAGGRLAPLPAAAEIATTSVGTDVRHDASIPQTLVTVDDTGIAAHGTQSSAKASNPASGMTATHCTAQPAIPSMHDASTEVRTAADSQEKAGETMRRLEDASKEGTQPAALTGAAEAEQRVQSAVEGRIGNGKVNNAAANMPSTGPQTKGNLAKTGRGITHLWKEMHWGGKTAIIGGTAVLGATLGYWAFCVKHDRANQRTKTVGDATLSGL